MKKVPVLAIAASLSAVTIFGLFCWTVFHLEADSLRFKLKAPWVELDAEVKKGEI